MFLHIPVSSMCEIQRNPVSAHIVGWYKAQHPSDDIEFVSDTYDDWPFSVGSIGDLKDYEEITASVVNTLINLGAILDNGIAWQDEDEPNTVFIRDLRLAVKMEQEN